MRRALLRNLTNLTRNQYLNNFKNPPNFQSLHLNKPNPDARFSLSSPILSKFRSFSSENDNNVGSVSEESSLDESEKKKLAVLDGVEDVSNKGKYSKLESSVYAHFSWAL